MFDFTRFLTDHWLDGKTLSRFLIRYGIRDVTEPAAHKWYVRAKIPSEWFPVLVCLLQLEAGKPVDLTPWFTPS